MTRRCALVTLQLVAQARQALLLVACGLRSPGVLMAVADCVSPSRIPRSVDAYPAWGFGRRAGNARDPGRGPGCAFIRTEAYSDPTPGKGFFYLMYPERGAARPYI